MSEPAAAGAAGLAPPRGLLLPATLAAAATTAIQLGWLERMKAIVAADPLARARGAPALAADSLRIDALAALGTLAFAIGLLVVRLRAAARGPGMSSLVPPTRGGRLLLLLVGTWTFVRWHASPGALTGFDVDLHAAHTTLVAQELRAGRLPSWTDAWYLGFPLLRYYGAAFYLPAAALAVGFDSARLGVKVVAAAWHLAAAPAAYGLARATGRSRGVSLTAGIVYAACPLFAHVLATMGSLTAAPVIALAPWALASSIRAGRGEGWRPAAQAGIALGLVAWAHPAYAVQVGALCALAFAGTAIAGSTRPLAALRAAATAAVTGALASLPLVLAWTLDGLPRPGAAPGVLGLVAPGPPSTAALARTVRPTLFPEIDSVGYVGLAFLALVAVGLLAGDASRRRPWFWLLLAATVVTWSGPTGFVRARALMFLPLVLAPVLAISLERAARARVAIVLAVAALLATDAAFGSIASPYRADLEPYVADLAAEARGQGQGRTVLVVDGNDGTASAGEWQAASEAPLRTPLGGFREGAPPAYEMLRATVSAVGVDPALADRVLRDHLASLGVTSVRRVAARRLAPDARRLASAPAIRFARERSHVPPVERPGADQVLAWFAAMTPPDGSSPSALRRVVLPGDGAPLPDREPTAPLDGVETIADERAGPSRSAAVRVPADGFLRFDEAWTRDLVVEVDGRPGDVVPDVFGLVVVAVTEGEHRIVLTRPDRFGWWPAPALALLVLAATTRRPRRVGAIGAVEGPRSAPTSTDPDPRAP